jgi:hypothetical protein
MGRGLPLDDLKAKKDTKHMAKRFRNLMLQEKGISLAGIHLKLPNIRAHLISNNVSLVRVENLLKPDDRQDVL